MIQKELLEKDEGERQYQKDFKNTFVEVRVTKEALVLFHKILPYNETSLHEDSTDAEQDLDQAKDTQIIPDDNENKPHINVDDSSAFDEDFKESISLFKVEVFMTFLQF